jgi:hypothetical protein
MRLPAKAYILPIHRYSAILRDLVRRLYADDECPTRMPVFVLKIKADLENIQRIHFNEDNMWKFDVESEAGEIREGITFMRSDELELSGSKGYPFFISLFSMIN